MSQADANAKSNGITETSARNAARRSAICYRPLGYDLPPGLNVRQTVT